MKTLIQHGWILTMNEQMDEYRDGYVLIEDEIITYAGDSCPDVTADEIVDAKGNIVIPGMINLHAHMSMIPFRSLGDDCPDRLRRFLFPLENACMNETLTYHGAAYAAAEMISAGITTVVDMYYFMDEVANACVTSGLRGFLGETIISQPTCDSEESYGGLDLGKAFIQKWKQHPLIHPMLAPHATNTNEGHIFQEAMAFVKKEGCMMTTHAAEMDYEMDYFKETYQKSPIAWLDDLGCLNEHMLLAHCIHVSSQDMELMGKRDVRVAHCIGSNMKAGKGIAPVKDMMERGIVVGLGSDGASSGNTLDLFTQMRMFAGAQKTKYHDRSLFPARSIVKLATIEGAKALHMEQQIGSIETGKLADLTIVDCNSMHMFPIYDPYSALVYSANASDVTDVWINGKRVLCQKCYHMDVSALRENLQSQMQEFIRIANEKAKEL